MTCQRCLSDVQKGYHKDPRTGRTDEKLFYCDRCYELVYARHDHDKNYQLDRHYQRRKAVEA